jgi:hypothetical protein
MNRTDRKLWAQTRTLADLGELTAQWLEGRIASVPGYCGGPAEETASLVPVLAAANRAGFVTDSSQPGESGDGWEQRAAVQGFARDETLERLGEACAACPEIVVIVNRAPRFRIRYKTATPVTRSGGRDYTWFGASLSRRHLSDSWTGYGECGDEAVDAICGAWQVTLVDTGWGREDSPLWAALADFASRTPSGAGGHARTPSGGGHQFAEAAVAVAQRLFAAAVALAVAGGIFTWLGTSWPVRLLAVYAAFAAAAAPAADDVEAGLIRFGESLDVILRRFTGCEH